MGNDLLDMVPGEAAWQMGERRLTLRPLRLRDWAELKRQYLRQRESPLTRIASAVAVLPEAQAKEILAKAYDETVKDQAIQIHEVLGWAYSAAGLPTLLWLASRRDAPDVTIDHCQDAIDDYDDARLRLLVETIDGLEGTGGNSSSRQARPATDSTPS